MGETADDSWGGEFSDLIPRTTDSLKRCLQADPPPASWLKGWLALASKDPWELVPTHEVVAVAGPAVQKAYSAHVAKDWHEWHAAHPQPKDDRDSNRRKRRQAYLQDLMRQGDEATAFEVMRGTASTAGEWADLVQWCEDRQRGREALEFAQTAYTLHPKDWRLEAALLRAYERDGWDEESLGMWRKRLESQPSSDNYQAVLQAAKRAGHDVAAYRQALFDWAQTHERRAEPSRGRLAMQDTVDVSVRVRWFLEVENELQAALDLLQPGVRCNSQLLLTLAKRLPKAQDARAHRILVNLFDGAMPRASTPYTEVLDLVRLALDRMGPNERAQWLTHLRSQYKAKRNFIKELPTS